MSAATVSPSHRGAVLLALPFFFFNDTATTEIYTLSLHDALPISLQAPRTGRGRAAKPGGGRGHAEAGDRKSTRLNSSHLVISYAVFCLKKKKQKSSLHGRLRILDRDCDADHDASQNQYLLVCRTS